MKIRISGGIVLDTVRGVSARQDIFIENGTIVGIVPSAPAGAIGSGAAVSGKNTAFAEFHPDTVIDASGKTVAPGLVDLSVKLRGAGTDQAGKLAAEMNAAAAGGVTSVVCCPDSDPIMDEPVCVQALTKRAGECNSVRLYPLGALTRGLDGERITEMVGLREAGCIGFSQMNRPMRDNQALLNALLYASTYGYTVWLAPQDAALAAHGVAAAGAFASRSGLTGIPVAAETIALHTIIELVRLTGTRVHLSHLSSAPGVQLVRAAKAEGLPISCDVTIYHVHLVDLDIGYFDALYRFEPPLRGTRDRDAIRAGLLDGTIDAICSDHTPVSDAAKRLPFAMAPAGASGLALLLALSVKWAEEERVPLARALSRVTTSPAALTGLDAGHIKLGAPADLCLFDAEDFWQVNPQALVNQGRNTPFAGYELPAPVAMTMVSGKVVFGSLR